MKYWILVLFVLGLAVRTRHIDGPLRWEERDIAPALNDISFDPEHIYIPPKAGDHTPLATILAWPFYVSQRHSAWILRIPSVISGSLLGPIAVLALTRIASPRTALIAGICITFNTFLINWSAYFMQEMSFQLFGLLGFIHLEWARRRQSFMILCLTSFFFALSFWSHEFAVVFIPLSFVYLFIHGIRTKSWLLSWKPWVACFIYAILISPYIMWNFSMKSIFSEYSGMSIAQQHILATLLANRGLNIRFLEYFVFGGIRDILHNPGAFELNHIDPLMGTILLCSAIVIPFTRYRSRSEVILATVIFWAVFGFFLVFDLQFRIYRLSILLIPACISAAYIFEDLLSSRKSLFRSIGIILIAYTVVSGTVHVPYAEGAAHRGFRWWRKGPIFDEQPLIDSLVNAQRKREASLVIMPGLFWDHVPLQAEYESGVRFVGGSRETIYSSTFWMRPYSLDEARRLRAVVSCQEDVQGWWDWLELQGYSGTMDVVELEFNGILEDTTMACPLFLFELEHSQPPPVSTIIKRIYQPR